MAIKAEESGPASLVWARVAGPIEACFPTSGVITTPSADVYNRACVPREQAMAAEVAQVRRLSYMTFKQPFPPATIQSPR
ncbi:hypothetical protein KBZ20_02100 [Vulcanococcus limneticus Candia 3F8]|uniref:hypothetical protein n=1 Tax=Vulcanococcus limneticus TaxID=2170428 RepID=UPI000B98B399|nr:hypothetical protein [Vulcanococcus limneticus]MCP9790489.1 hypothetical protein [Vulcanococcus limneticus MW73D5]MCP9892568.1 hypothetical protein [Vulcanococcus limneticus Candia 3F8]MCP9896096.1 hypothetical protein [Vulcanococcus limneticus Candia 3B3]